jgi:hypothetical protein
MKKQFITFIAAVPLLFSILIQSFPKEESSPLLPKELIGQWQFGTASMTEIWDKSTNTFLGNAFELSVRFHFKANGEYEQYFVAGSRSVGSCRINVFNIEYGTVRYDPATKILTTHPNKVKNKFYNCGSVSQSETIKDLKDNSYTWRTAVAPSGTPTFEVKMGGGYSVFYKQ